MFGMLVSGWIVVLLIPTMTDAIQQRLIVQQMMPSSIFRKEFRSVFCIDVKSEIHKGLATAWILLKVFQFLFSHRHQTVHYHGSFISTSSASYLLILVRFESYLFFGRIAVLYTVIFDHSHPTLAHLHQWSFRILTNASKRHSASFHQGGLFELSLKFELKAP